MVFDGIWIEENDLAQFMNEVKPESAFTVEMDGCYWVFEFTTEEDYNRAYIWYRTKYPFIYGNKGSIYYDTVSKSYAWECFNDNTIKTGFSDEEEAETSFFDYLEENCF